MLNPKDAQGESQFYHDKEDDQETSQVDDEQIKGALESEDNFIRHSTASKLFTKSGRRNLASTPHLSGRSVLLHS
jgi:hypothetical protein